LCRKKEKPAIPGGLVFVSLSILAILVVIVGESSSGFLAITYLTDYEDKEKI
jgi:hypothetical protein